MTRPMIWLATMAASVALASPAAAFPPQDLQPADAPDDSPWLNNELTGARVGWDSTTLTYELDITIEYNAAVLWMSAGIPGGETDFSSASGYGGGFPSAVTSSLGIDHMAGVWGCNDLYVFDVVDNGSTDVTSAPGVTAYRSTAACDGTADTLHVEVDWDHLYGMGAGAVPAGLTLYVAAFIRASDDTGSSDNAPDQGVTGEFETFYEIEVDGDWDGVPDGSWAQPGNNQTTPNPVDGDGDGLPAYDGDCDDSNANAHPGNTENCGDGADNDCDGLVDGADGDCGGDDDDTAGDDDDDDTAGDDDDDTAGDDDDDDTAGDDDDTAGDDDDAADDDDTWWDDDDTSDDDTVGDDDTTEYDDVNVGCTCGKPGLPPEGFSFTALVLLGLSLGVRRRLS
jgi:hypothetical protein